MAHVIKKIVYISSFLFLLLSGSFFMNHNIHAEPATNPGQSEIDVEQTTDRKKMVIIGDSYAMGYTIDDSVDPDTESWAAKVIEQRGTADSLIVAKTGAGFVKTNEGEYFTTLLEKAWELSDDPASVEEIVVCGGFNDRHYSSSTIYYAAQFFANTAKKLFPNSEVYIGMVAWHENNSAVQSQLMTNSLIAYRQAAQLNGLHYISGCEYLFQNNRGVFSQDCFHPNAYGHSLLADYITCFLQEEDYYTGLKKEDGQWYWYENGKINEEFTGLRQNEYGWWFIQNGMVDFGYNGFAVNENGWWYVEDGKITFQKNDIIKGIASSDLAKEEEEAWWYVKGSKVTPTQTVAKNIYGWWYVNFGKVDFAYTGVQRNDNGWWYVKDGKVDFSYNGFAANEYGWWYAENGKVTFEKNDILKGAANVTSEKEGEEAWWFIAGSRVTRAETVAKNANGWWYINEGKVDFSYNGIQANEHGKWYIKDGQVDFLYNGFVYFDQIWWLIKDGRVDDTKDDIIYGEANSLPNADPEAAWWLIKDGKVTNMDTIGENEYGYWFVKNGKVDFTYSGFEFVDNCIWQIREGKAVPIARY